LRGHLRHRWAKTCRWLIACASSLWITASDAAPDESIRRGEYVFRAAGCATCHTDRDNNGPFLAGGRALETSFGTFYSPNITPDPQYGIGRWSEADFVRALRQGVSPNGEYYYPVFPYTAYTRMTRDDMLALKAYLFSVPPVARENRPHELAWYVRARPLLWFWKLLYFDPGEYRTDATRSKNWNRGAYLATALAHCGECHTPRNVLGAPDNGLYYAGTREGPEGVVVPNITPDRKTGIGRWRPDELAEYLRSGLTPDGDFAGSLMADVIDDGLRYLDDTDIEAIVDYILSLTPIEHAVERQKKNDKRRNAFE
jgi:mono/diheme cytochrome c family protein